MRMELYRYNRTGTVWGFFIGLFITWGLFIALMATGRHNLPLLTILGIFLTLSASITIYAAAAYLRLLRKGSKNTPPLIIIDDAGLWNWRDGLMPWSEIQAIEWKEACGREDSDIIVVWRRQRYSFSRWRPLMDGSGKGFGAYPLFYNELKACWERNRRRVCRP
jgi:hypothetical protein